MRKDLEGFSEIVFGIGFLVVYFADEIFHYCYSEAIQHNDTHGDEYQPILPSQNHSQSSYGTRGSHQHEESQRTTHEEHHNRHDVEDENISEPCQQTTIGIIGMLVALSFQSLLEGLVIGIQDTTPKVMILFTAVISHKLAVAFCLGVLTASRGSTYTRHLLAIIVFSFGSVLGILMGMGLVVMYNATNTDSKFLPILQGIGGGTILYVTLCEVLPHEKALLRNRSSKNSAGLSQLAAFTVGFVVMTLINLFITKYL